MLVRHVEDRRARTVAHGPGRLCHLEGDNLTALDRVPEHLELDEARVPPRDVIQLVADPARLIPGAPDGVACGGLLSRELFDRLAIAGLLEAELQAPIRQFV